MSLEVKIVGQQLYLGCRKTQFPRQMTLPLFIFNSKLPKRIDSPRHQDLLAASVNDPIDKISKRLR